VAGADRRSRRRARGSARHRAQHVARPSVHPRRRRTPSRAAGAGVTTVPAILLGGRETAVPVARSLAAAGVPVHAVGRREDPLRYSRACATYTIVDGADVQPAWLEWLAERREPGVILPSCDDALELVAGHRAELVA